MTDANTRQIALRPPRLEYTGNPDKQPLPGEIDQETGQRLYPYLPTDPGLVEAVNLAIFLERPLLLKGDPGCGKTQLARAVAFELGLPFEAWYVKSTSRARDGIYTYDNVRRLRDAQLATTRQGLGRLRRKIMPDLAYVKYGPLGRALTNNRRTVLLIDEIDKADIDFPNDLLLELDEQRFVLEEVSQKGNQFIQADSQRPPIIFITSNEEKALPRAFLRRCLFYQINFPDKNILIQIINARFPQSDPELVEKAVTRFVELRKKMQDDKVETAKKVSTSELIDWFEVLRNYSPQDEVLSQLDQTLPFTTVLLKSWEDHKRYLTGAK